MSSTGPQLRRDAARNRSRILEVAAEVFSASGLDASYDEIARRAGVGVGTVYRRFPERAELIQALFESRIEEIVGSFAGAVDVVTARALAPLPQLLAWCEELLRTGALGLFPKGQHLDTELTDSARYWKIQATTVSSVTDDAGRILMVRSAERRADP